MVKEAGLLTAAARGEPCLVDRLEAWLDRQSFGRYRLSTVHRLDRDTSGLLVFARTPRAATGLAKQFAAHRAEREYVAIVAGRLAAAEGSFRTPLDDKRAVTHYRTLWESDSATAVAVRLETGRRNQIRRHFAATGHPVLGDYCYEPELARHPDWPHRRLALHARLLGFEHPMTRETLRFLADPPPEFDAMKPSTPLAPWLS